MFNNFVTLLETRCGGTDRQTDRQTDMRAYRAAIAAKKEEDAYLITKILYVNWQACLHSVAQPKGHY